MVETLTVQLGDRSYPLHFGEDVPAQIRAEVARMREAGRKIAVLTDAQVAKAQSDRFAALFGDAPVLVVPAGESAKSLNEFGRALDFLAEKRIDRSGALFAFGGGVVGDLAGFAASAWLRGIDFYQVPTTLLAMVDSSVGGKTGINVVAGKNLVGAFHQPRGVFIDPAVLRTLPPREFAAGMAEVIKYGLLGDGALFTRLERQPLTVESSDLAGIIRRCCEIKAEIVRADERELAKEGGRALLNLGHTFAHAIEQVAGYGAYLHGEAVAIGLSAASRLSQKLDIFSVAEVSRVESVLAAHQLPIRLRASLRLDDLLAAMARDKKVRAGLLRFVVLHGIGEARTRDSVPLELAEQAFRDVGAV
jgi:3-dehydroquinate synthase